MKYHFSKEIISHYNPDGYGYLRDSRLYKVFDNGTIVGQCFCTDEVAFFAYDNEDMRIDIKKRFFKTDIYTIINQKNSSQIGSFDFPEVRSSKQHQGRMILDDCIYLCKELLPDTKFKLFDKETWWHYKIGFGNNDIEVIFRCKLNLSFFVSTGTAQRISFNGQVDMKGDDLFILFAGLFMLDQFFRNEDND